MLPDQLRVTNFVLTITPDARFGGWIFFTGDLQQNTSIILQSSRMKNTSVFGRQLDWYRRRSEYFVPSQQNPYPLDNAFNDQPLKYGEYQLIVESVNQGFVNETSLYYRSKLIAFRLNLVPFSIIILLHKPALSCQSIWWCSFFQSRNTL